MSIDWLSGSYIPTCDNCGARLWPEGDFYDAVEAKKRAGWKSRKVNGDWEDWCDTCLDEENDPKNIFRQE